MPLTEIGVAQATQAAGKVKARGLTSDHIFTSSMVRAQETAKFISKAISSPKPVIMQDLIERDFGTMPGISQFRVTELCAPDIIVAEK